MEVFTMQIIITDKEKGILSTITTTAISSTANKVVFFNNNKKVMTLTSKEYNNFIIRTA